MHAYVYGTVPYTYGTVPYAYGTVPYACTAIITDQFTLKLQALTVAIRSYVANNFRVIKFLKKSAVKDYLQKQSRDPASHYLLISHFKFLFSKIPHSFRNFCKKL